jgi:hypothetical protein
VDIYKYTLIGDAQNLAGADWLEQDSPHVERILDIPAYGRHHWYNRFTPSLSLLKVITQTFYLMKEDNVGSNKRDNFF